MALLAFGKNVTEEDANVEPTPEVKTTEEINKDVAVISSTTRIDGNIQTEGHLVLSGTVTGNVSAKGNLVLSGVTSGELYCENIIVEARDAESDIIAEKNIIIKEGCSVHGNVNCENITVFGTVCGDIQARGTVVIKATASVEGNIAGASICMENGAKVNGNVCIQ